MLDWLKRTLNKNTQISQTNEQPIASRVPVNRFLSDELYHWANLLKNGTGDYFYAKTAFEQILVQGNVFFDNERLAHACILSTLTGQQHHTENQLAEKLGDFRWDLFDECVTLCQEHGLTESSFYLALLQPPKEPSLDNKDSLNELTIPELKSLLKVVNQPLSGKKDELINRLWVHLPIAQTDALLNQKYQEQLEIYQKRRIANKYKILLQTIKYRVNFFFRITEHLDHSDTGFLTYHGYTMDKSFVVNPEQDSKLSELCGELSDVRLIVNGVLFGVLPQFPNDNRTVKLKSRFVSERLQQRHNQT